VAATPLGAGYQIGGPPNPYLPQAPSDILEHVPPAWLHNPYSPSPIGIVRLDRSTGFGLDLIRTMIQYEPAISWSGLSLHTYELDTVQAGWPARAVEMWITHDLVDTDLLPPGSTRPRRRPDLGGPHGWSWGTPASSLLSSSGAFSEFPFYRAPCVLPLKPRPLAFAVNTAFYATLAWLLCGGPASIRRAWRTRNHQCAACAYPIGTSPVCPECGNPVNPRPAAPE
jgi:hypothetical protein